MLRSKRATHVRCINTIETSILDYGYSRRQGDEHGGYSEGSGNGNGNTPQFPHKAQRQHTSDNNEYKDVLNMQLQSVIFMG